MLSLCFPHLRDTCVPRGSAAVFRLHLVPRGGKGMLSGNVKGTLDGQDIPQGIIPLDTHLQFK